MATAMRSRIEPTNDWATLELCFDWPEQEAYELIRPVVLFGHSSAERARQTGISRRTLYRKARRFDAEVMAGLTAARPQEDARKLPAAIVVACRSAVDGLSPARANSRPNAASNVRLRAPARRHAPRPDRAGRRARAW